MQQPNYQQLADDIKRWGRELGFQDIGISDIELTTYAQRLQQWLAQGYHGEMAYLERYAALRTAPEKLVPGTQTAIVVRLDYMPPHAEMAETLRDKARAYISRYALGRDYHKLIRKRLEKLAHLINQKVTNFGYRAFADSAPVMEKPLAEKAGLGWMGKNTLILNRHAGSYFFLGVLYTSLPLPIDEPVKNHCGRCSACIDVCPTRAIVAPYQLDARRCLAYLTIEFNGSIPVELRSLMGNRIFGCDDCQLVCPWNRFAKLTQEIDFLPRHNLKTAKLLELFAWSENEFREKTQGSPLKRAGYQGWLRNIAVALGNADYDEIIIVALKTKLTTVSPLVAEHIEWALDQQTHKKRLST
ncbi:MAG: tRNA epoxyqueuosine(34) reductase QueG [Gammaproteobacteria bacterium]